MIHKIGVRPISEADSLKELKNIQSPVSIYRQALNELVVDIENTSKINGASIIEGQLFIDTNLKKEELLGSIEHLFIKYWERVRYVP